MESSLLRDFKNLVNTADYDNMGRGHSYQRRQAEGFEFERDLILNEQSYSARPESYGCYTILFDSIFHLFMH